eukprot:gb/GECG01007406.1/.p1 GENE.gb/GECG01007406.1/~~gb/GECG01007406.1/.p1  ORF type:complete len:141 (+),score=15.38 gb/GECG01007406.1/:1-423(+)
MVYVTASGDVIPDNDPRAKQRRQPGGSSPQQSSRGFMSSSNMFHGGASGSGGTGTNTQAPAPRGQGGAGGAGGEGFVDKIARMIGVHGMAITSPAMFGLPQTEIPLIYFIFIGIGLLFFGWKALLIGVLFLFFFISNQAH